MTTNTTKIAGEDMKDAERILALADQYRIDYRGDYSRNSSEHQADLLRFARALLESKPAVPQTLSDGAQYFACYLIDNCENEVIREESVQAWLGKMLASPRYHPTAPAQSCGDAEQVAALAPSNTEPPRHIIDAAMDVARFEYGHGVTRASIVAIWKALGSPWYVIKPLGDAEQADEAVAWLHTMHMELDQTDERLSFTDSNPWGEPGVNYSEEYEVTSEPLYTAARTKDSK